MKGGLYLSLYDFVMLTGRTFNLNPFNSTCKILHSYHIKDFPSVFPPDESLLSTSGGLTMTLKGFMRSKLGMNLLKTCVILLLTVFFFFVINMDRLEANLKKPSIIPWKRVASAPPKPGDFCTFKPVFSDGEEERLILGAIAWPETPLLPSPLSLNQTSDPAHSTFTILPGKGGGRRQIGDHLKVMIRMNDFNGNPKKSGGDVLIARLHNRKLAAGVAGRVVDHLNGSYSTVFTLLWEGSAQVEVILVHPSEAVTVLRRVNREHPDRIIFKNTFHSGSTSETTTCNVCLTQTKQTQCNFTDLRTGDPWFCYKPKNLSCDAKINHKKTGYRRVLMAEEKTLFQGKVNLKVPIRPSGPASVTVLPKKKGQPRLDESIEKPGHAGYYYKNVWQSLDGTKVHQFNDASAISKCLRGKVVHLYGDSTIRQWYEYLDVTLPDAKTVNLNSPKQAGPYMMWDQANQILITYRVHGLPLRINMLPTSKESYIANNLDTLVGGKNTVVAFGICAHFSTFPIGLYIRRLQSIRKAVVRLLDRGPGTLVVIKTGTLTHLQSFNVESNSDWFSIRANRLLKAMFKGLNVHLVDAWDMVTAHYLPHNIHPKRPIIKNMVDVLLSYICTKK